LELIPAIRSIFIFFKNKKIKDAATIGAKIKEHDTFRRKLS